MTITEIPDSPSVTKPTIPENAPAGTRVVRTRATDADGSHRWALAVRLTAGNMTAIADQTGWRRMRAEETLTGRTSAHLHEGEQALAEGDWAALIGDRWIGYTNREMNQSFTSVRGGVLSGR